MRKAFRKIARRSSAELRERLEQKLAALAERAGLRDTGEPNDDAFLRRVSVSARAAGLDALVDSVHRGPRPPFFPGADDAAATAAVVRARWPERVPEIVREAQDVVAGRFTLLGHGPIQIDDPIDWHRDPLAGITAPRAHWSVIRYLDPSVVGDHKVVWELSRHQYLVTLAQAHALTGDSAYARRAVNLLESWMDANPPKLGIHWASSLEVAYRALAWCWTHRMLRRTPAFTRATTLRLLKFLDVSARHLERYLSTYFSPNTHLTGEALGLLYIGTQFPELAGAKRWVDRGWSILLGELSRQVRPDGSYFEQATYYHRYTLDIYMHARILGVGAKLPDVERVDDALARLADFLRWTARGDGTIPLFGDEDGGRLLFLDGRLGDDVRGSVAATAVLLGRGDVALTGDATDEVPWLLGPAGMKGWDRLTKSTPDHVARAFPDGGFFVMRDGWRADASVVTIDCGPLGAANGGHAHADTLAFDLSVGGNPIFVDAGTVTYTGDDSRRDTFRHSRVHNTVTLDSVSSSESAGAFQWNVMTPGVTDVWIANAAGAFFEGHHDGYQRLHEPARVQRQLLSARDGWWIVRDVISGSGEHHAAATFQCAPELDLSLADDAIRVSDDGRVVVSVRALQSSSTSNGVWRSEPGIASRRYGATTEAPRAIFEFTTHDTTSVAYALTRGDVADAVVTHERRAACDIIRIRDHAHEDLVLFDPRDAVDGVRTDARMAWIRRRLPDRVVQSLMVIGGTIAEVDGATVVQPAGGAVSAVLAPDGWRIARAAPLGARPKTPRHSNEV